MERVPILEDGQEVSHLAVRYERPNPDAQGADRPCILYLHGFGSQQTGEKADFFRRQALAEGFPFCSFDFQGHGQSGGSLRELTLSRNLEDVGRVHAYLRERGHERLILLGSSMGAGTALWYSAHHQDDILAGLHIAPALEMGSGLLTWAGPERARLWQETGILAFQNEWVTCELGWGLIEDLRTYPLEDLRARYRAPSLLLQGKQDATVSWRSVLDFATDCAYPEIELHLFLDGDHRLTDRKEKLWGLMREFLRGKHGNPS